MALQPPRARANTLSGPHSISLKVLRLSRPSLQTPGQNDGGGVALDLKGGRKKVDGSTGEEEDLAPGDTLQYTLSHDLKEEGAHVLAVTVSYTETSRTAEGGASGGRARTFRKLYQFVAQPLLAVRSKITAREGRGKENDARQWTLEAQLEHVGEVAVVLEKVWLKEEEGMKGRGLNGKKVVVLKPSDVEQVMFLVEEREKGRNGVERVPLGELNVDWRSAMGERGGLTTGCLSSRAS